MLLACVVGCWTVVLDSPNMTKDECLQFVQKALAHAMARDGSSGGVIRTVAITAEGVERGFVSGDQLPFSL